MWVLVVWSVVWLGGVQCELGREAQGRLIDGLALAAAERIKEVGENGAWDCACSYHECGLKFEDKLMCINSRVKEDNKGCPSQGDCTPIGVGERLVIYFVRNCVAVQHFCMVVSILLVSCAHHGTGWACNEGDFDCPDLFPFRGT